MVMEYLSLKIVSLCQCREPSSPAEESEEKGDRNEQEQEQEEAMQCYLRGLELLLKENAEDNDDGSYHHDHDDHPTGRRLTLIQILRSKLLFSYAQYLYFQDELGDLFELYYILYPLSLIHI